MLTRTLIRLADRFKNRHSDFQPLFEPYTGSEVVSLDCEMTGLDTKNDHIVSIGAVKIDGNQVKTGESFEAMIDHRQWLSEESIRIHRIRKVDLDDAVSIETAVMAMIEFIGNRPILGYNLRFDLKFLDRYTKPLLGFSLPNQMIELSDLYRKSVVSKRPDVVPHLGFEEILDDLDVPIFGRHTALGDATTVAMAYIKLKRSR
ncbi:MAG: 3'-5' exonuclease [Litorivicinaceae bacterium]|nr:3'-5' exonuclease [Litorivicinaceae bacterium]